MKMQNKTKNINITNILIVIILLMSFMCTMDNVNAAPEYKLIYVVQQGDTLSEIAEGYGVEVDSILHANNIY